MRMGGDRAIRAAIPASRSHALLSFEAPEGASLPPCSLRACRVVEAVSAPRRATVDIAYPEHVDLEPLLRTEAALTLTGSAERRFPLVIGSGEYLGHARGAHHYRLELFDRLWLLGLTLDTRKLRNLSAEDIVGLVLGEIGVEHRFQLTRRTPVRKYCCQYRETDLDFIHRLLEFEGIHYYHDEDGILVLADASKAAPRVAGAPFELSEAEDALAHGEPCLSALRRVSRVAPGRVTVSDYSWKRPDLTLRESASADRDTHLSLYELFAGYRLPDQGARLAALRLEAHRAEARSLEGRASILALAVGHAFEVGASAGGGFAGEYFLCRVEHTLEGGPGDHGLDADAPLTYTTRFVAIPLDVPFRPLPRTPRPEVGGVHTAMVRGPAGEEIHTDRHGRFRAQFHWDQEGTGTDQDSRWLRMTQETSTSITLARVGWEISVGYIDGDPDRPIGLSRMINGAMAPSYRLPDHQNMMAVQTPSSPATGGYSELTMDDSADGQAIRLRAERDLDIAVKNEKTERVGNDEEHFVGTNLTRRVIGDQSVAIGRHSTTTVGGNEQVLVQGSRAVQVGGSEQTSVGNSESAAVGGGDRERVGALRLTVAGAIKPPDFKAMARSAVATFASTLSPTLTQAATAVASGGGLKGLLPAVGSLFTYPGGGLPSAASLSAAGKSALHQATGGLSDGVTVDELISLVATGGIERSAEKGMTRMVGGAYVTVAVLGVDTKVAYGHLEAIGALKLTSAAKNIQEGVTGDLKILVGGSAMRTSGEKITILAGAASSVKVGGAARYSGGQKLSIGAEVVRVEGQTKLLLKGGGAEISLAPGGVSLKGELNLQAGGTIQLSGASKLDVT
ncbi:MAG: type VI secretion system tip protein VgrG [Polyangiaceae bacterium]|nr:type VI secretion system tip protein VgrG [Polyangiaceae bacterium]